MRDSQLEWLYIDDGRLHDNGDVSGKIWGVKVNIPAHRINLTKFSKLNSAGQPDLPIAVKILHKDKRQLIESAKRYKEGWSNDW